MNDPLHSTCRTSAVLSLLLAACTVGPDYVGPDLTGRTAAAWRQPTGDVIRAERTELAALTDRLLPQDLAGSRNSRGRQVKALGSEVAAVARLPCRSCRTTGVAIR